jgi:hypothetical protein
MFFGDVHVAHLYIFLCYVFWHSTEIYKDEQHGHHQKHNTEIYKDELHGHHPQI